MRSIRAQQRCRPDLSFRAIAVICAIVAGVVLTQPVPSCAATVSKLSVPVFADMAARCENSVAPQTLLAVAKVESNFSVFAIHDNTTERSYNPTSQTEAIKIAQDLTSLGHSIDLGIMQINNANLTAFGVRAEDAFNPCRSMEVAATILSLDYKGGDNEAKQQGALRAALSAYNTGNDTAGFRNGYVKRVEVAAREVVPAIETGGGILIERPPAGLPEQAKSDDWDVWGELRPRSDSSQHKGGTSAVDPSQSGAMVFSDGG
jgi:type IV secretion system protein VirB1